MRTNKKHLSVAGIIFRNDYKEVLLVKRKDIPVWVLPGGGIEPNESPAQATSREVQEETGYVVKIKKKVGEFHPKNKLTKLTYLYECTILGGFPTETSETTGIGFFSIDDLPILMPPPYYEWIKEAAKQPRKPIIKQTESVTYTVLLQKTVKHPLMVCRYFLNRWKAENFG